MRTSSPADDREAGVALVTVLLASLIIGGLVVVLVSSAVAELRSTASASAFEAGIHTAEQAVEATFLDYDGGAEECIGDDLCDRLRPGENAATERAAVLEAIERRDEGLVPVSDAEDGGVAVGPVSVGGRVYVYGVSFVDRGVQRDRSRVVRVQLSRTGPTPPPPPEDNGSSGGGQIGPIGDHAILINGDVHIAGNLHRLSGTVHTNGDLTMRDYIFESNQQLREYTGPWSATGEVTCVDPNAYHGGCYRARGLEEARPEIAPLFRSEQPEVQVPEFEATEVHAAWAYELREHWFDLCYPGLRHADHATVVQPSSPDDGPCEGEVVYTITGDWPHQHYQGWRYRQDDRAFFRSWGGMPDDGVYYAHERNVDTNALGSSTKRITVIASHDPADSNGANSGNIFWRGNSHYLFFENDDGFQLAAFADRDIDGRQGTHIAEGVVYAREQIRLGGDSDITGQLIAAGSSVSHPGQANTPGSPVATQTGGEEWTGSIYVDYAPYNFSMPGSDQSSDTGGGDPGDPETGPTGPVEVLSWEEL